MTTYNVSNTDSTESIQSAINSLAPGDILTFAAGDYSLGSGNTCLYVNISGTSTNPITIQGGGNTPFATRLFGVGVGDNSTTPPANTSQIILDVNCSWVNFQNFQLKEGGRSGFRVAGSNQVWTEVVSTDHWSSSMGANCVGTHASATNITFRYVETSHNRNHTGIVVGPWSESDTFDVDDITFIRCFGWRNGENRNGDIINDGNDSDAFEIFKAGIDGAANNPPLRIRFYQCLAWLNRDDGLDLAAGDGTEVVGCFAFQNGNPTANPGGRRGLKYLRAMAVGTSKIIGSGALGNLGVGFEPRHQNGCVIYHSNNAALNNGGNSFTYDAGSVSGVWTNNAYDNGNNPNGTTEVDNITSPAIRSPLTNGATNLNLPAGSVEDRWRFIYDQIRRDLLPISGGNCDQTGTFNASVHAATADDDEISPADPEEYGMVHWTGSAPQIGPFPYRYIDPPTALEIL